MAKLQNLKIMDMLHAAKEHVQYPKLRLHNTYTLQLAGAKAAKPGTVNITDGKPYGENRFFGRILRSGEFEFSRNVTTAEMTNIALEFELFAKDPVEYAQIYGKNTGQCMFCGRHLTDPQSIAVGYGPICAENYGLPHGELDKAVADEFSQLELDVATLNKHSEGDIPLAVMTMLYDIAKTMLSEPQKADLKALLTDMHDERSRYNTVLTALWEHTV